MYQIVSLEDTVRIPPTELGYEQAEVVKKLVHKNIEGRLNKKHGLVVAAFNIERVGEGRVIHGDGAVFQRVRYAAVCFLPAVGELVEGTICEVVEFGAFVRFGPLDGLLHMSQIMNDYLNVDIDNERLIGKESGRMLAINDKVRARLVTVSLNELSPRESKIGLTMRQTGLGKLEWIEEDRLRKEGKLPEKPQGGGARRGGGGRGGPRGGRAPEAKPGEGGA
ncbi:MAG TPA: DNA-directed RNA polymerase [Candidatus Thermoplasmatota archaeon]|nr:DNA-directed RNA polymerase [Candidatus Thermoplasmatota archaeon]